jgi:transposase-like protein
MGVRCHAPQRFFPPEYKAEVVALIRTTGKTVGQVAPELDPIETAVRQSSAPTWMPAGAATASPPPSMLRRLRREVRNLRKEALRLPALERAAFLSSEVSGPGPRYLR